MKIRRNTRLSSPEEYITMKLTRSMFSKLLIANKTEAIGCSKKSFEDVTRRLRMLMEKENGKNRGRNKFIRATLLR